MNDWMSPQAADRLLKQLDCLSSATLTDASDRSDHTPLRQALLVVAAHSDYQMLGVCAETFAQGQQALMTYAAALGYQPISRLEPIAGPVYIKFNPKTGGCYVSPYEGRHRGVLVSCQSADESGLNEMYGHLPLALFADRSSPPG
jgi:hypothetical protein